MPTTNLTRRELLAGAGAAALLLDRRDSEAQPPPGRPIVFARTTVVMRGQFDQAAGAAGKLSVTERFTSRKTGKRVDVCATGTLAWSARS